ncbi:zeta toxin family protein [Aestuariirhabdus haliotis]|uniref:zeta toxin family protein n=1 Tax=Aestuariirhabdus haliotis TaxID=2918751 RepID=UPI0020BEC431|nr:AAA family ATPase [Aestuariirhabdus haliotis]MCL6419708.1 zeta toxin family protein [Aestuariirhabdus haliotis]
MNVSRQLWLLAGGNGAGKSTFYRTRLEPLGIPFVNADLIARELYPDTPEIHSYEAAMVAEEKRMGLLEEGRSFCFETVFSHPSKIDFVARAKALGYQIILVFIHLESSSLNQARVSQRVEEGGHNVPTDKIQQRIPRLLANIKVAIPLCDQVRLLDNSRLDDPFRVVATLRRGCLEVERGPLIGWVEDLLVN